MKKVYFTGKEVSQGIDELPPISESTLRYLRQTKKITYTKIGRDCVYKKEWIDEYINKKIIKARI